jgi:uncharacterized metal-binding protein YceD (DUF177 family)
LQPFRKESTLNPLKQYNIGFVGLSLGKHEFSFRIDESFFSCFDYSEVSKGNLSLELLLEKQNNMLVFDFLIKGNVELICDHCLEPYQQDIEDERRLYVKFGDAFSEQTDEIVVIPVGESHFDVSQFVYEYITLALPMQRIHSEDGIVGKGCDPAITDKLNQYLGGKKPASGERENSPWDALKGLKFND